MYSRRIVYNHCKQVHVSLAKGKTCLEESCLKATIVMFADLIRQADFSSRKDGSGFSLNAYEINSFTEQRH